MKLKFKQQQYQSDATQAVVNCFAGQSKGHRKEIVGRHKEDLGYMESEVIVEEIFSNKKLELGEEALVNNVQAIQQEQGLKSKDKLEGLNFTIEMETGTGKTYVYTKTMFELNKLYGWSKFIIMVPSVAIREGVHKSLDITTDHFQELYGKKIRFSIYDNRNKSNLVNIKSFANTTNIEVIIMNYQAFNVKKKGKEIRGESARKIYQKLDALQSERPIDILKRARPILIIDEPQRFGDKAEALLSEFNPLFVLRYSATHKKEYNKIYRLDAIDAYNQKLVKRISVKGIDVIGNEGTNNYLYLDKINISTKHYPTASIELEINQKSGIKKVIKKIEEKDDLYQLSGELKQYKGFVVKEINGLKDSVSFTNGHAIFVGQSIGEVDEQHTRRIQIRETIKSHLEKEALLFSKGIKVLSLFFIDKVEKYRQYDDNKNILKGEYATIFEEEYAKAIENQSLFNQVYNDYLNNNPVDQIHKGYFSIDKKGLFIDSKEKKNEGGSDDVSAYDLIMKNKERLLSFSEPTRFIFSHSALREGWDNPNVFQICTLKHSQSTMSKRQEIGRGLRICVNNEGERMDTSILDTEFFDINTLTVVASESYETFAKDLQNEIVASLSERPVTLTQKDLVDIVLTNENDEKITITETTAMDLIIKFKEKGYVDDTYKITDKLIYDIKADSIELPEAFKNHKNSVCEMMENIYSTATFEACTNEKKDNVNEAILKPNDNFAKKEFQDLWNKIKVKTVYEVDFDSSELISKSITAIDNDLKVKKVIVEITEGGQISKIDEASLKSGESMTEGKSTIENADSLLGAVKYDLIAEIAKPTKLTRKSIVKILQGIKKETFANFKANPESFIKAISKIINIEKATTLINSIVYSKIEDTYDDEIFTINNFKGSLSKNILKFEKTKHIYNFVKTDSETERKFATSLENNEIAVYAKLPSGFKIPTPVGNYNPDWAIVFDSKEYKHVYFIAETKGSMETLQLKEIESRKINYAKKHFAALDTTNIKYDVITTYEDLLEKVL